jgi:hypothetical protein
VRVPVLSEQITLTDPRVSTVFNDLQRILFWRMILAVIVKEAVKAIGRPSGMKAIATETQSTIRVGTLIQPGWALRRYAALGSLAMGRQRVINDLPDNDHNYNHSEHNGTDDDDKVDNLPLKRSEASLWCVGHLRNLSKHGGITRGDDYAHTTTRYAVSSLHANASCLKVVVVGAIDGTGEWKRLA